MTDTIEREMTITHADFHRLLPKALGDKRYSVNNDKIEIKIHEGKVTIYLEPEKSRKIGALELPVTQIKFLFENICNSAQKEFFSRFDLAYHKGGG